MRLELKSKFIQQLNRKSKDRGFTLIELLVVILIIGILGAIAIPNLLSQDVKAKQTEGRQNIALFNKAQNSYRAENSAFASTFDTLAIGSVVGGAIGTTTNFYYGITSTTTTDTTNIIGFPKDGSLKGYSGGAARFSNNANMAVIGTVICENLTVGTATAMVAPSNTGGIQPTCAVTTTALSL